MNLKKSLVFLKPVILWNYHQGFFIFPKVNKYEVADLPNLIANMEIRGTILKKKLINSKRTDWAFSTLFPSKLLAPVTISAND